MFCKSLFLAERHFLVFWESEDTVSIHPQKEVLHLDNTSCKVNFKKKTYIGKICGSGKFVVAELAGCEVEMARKFFHISVPRYQE